MSNKMSTLEVSGELPSIPEFFSGRSIFITGGSGFMGKVLIEKLLRSCPDLDAIYLLLRVKKGKTLEERIEAITSDRLFERLRTELPEALRKLRVVAGDVAVLGLGLSDEDRLLLQREVSVVFHGAASVRFNDALRDAVVVNVRGTREVLELAKQMTQLKAFLHLSTAFCHCNQSVIAEKMYPAPGSWQKMIRFVETTDGALVDIITPKLIGSLPNTYTYAKALSEQMINDYRDELPVVIVRPSIVTCTATEPQVGWVDNLNGPMGIWVGSYTGVLRIIYANPHQELDCVYVDTAIKSMIFFAWQRALVQPRKMQTLPIYNCCTMATNMSHQAFFKFSEDTLKKYPTMKSVWKRPSHWSLTENYPYYYLNFILFHMLPALLADTVIKAMGLRPMFVRLYRRIFIASNAVSFFTTHDFRFANSEFLAAERCMLPQDIDQFGYARVVPFDKDRLEKSVLLIRQTILKDPITTMDKARIRSQRLYFLDRGLKCVTVLVLGWLLARTVWLHSAACTLSWAAN